MRRGRMPDMKEAGVNVTPLIDVVMVMIIFFMLIAKIGVTTGADASIDVPSSILGTDLKTLSDTLTLNVREGPADEPMVTALVDGSGRQAQEIKLLDKLTNTRPLLKLLQMAHQQNANVKVIIRGEKEMSYRFLEPVLITCMEANVKSVAFNTSKQVETVQ
jgi:biopolymer transport protein ExbD